MANDDFTPRFVNDTANPLKITFTDNEGAAYDLSGLTGSSFSLQLHENSTLTTTTGTGTWTIVSASNGIAQYQWASADVASVGTYNIIVSVTFPTGPLHFRPKVLEILPIN